MRAASLAAAWRDPSLSDGGASLLRGGPVQSPLRTPRDSARGCYLLRENRAELIAPGVADEGQYRRDLVVAEDVPPGGHAVIDEPVQHPVHHVVLVAEGVVAREA